MHKILLAYISDIFLTNYLGIRKLYASSKFSSNVQLAIQWLLHQKEATGFGRPGVFSIPTGVCKCRFLSWVSAKNPFGEKIYTVSTCYLSLLFFFLFVSPLFSLFQIIFLLNQQQLRQHQYPCVWGLLLDTEFSRAFAYLLYHFQRLVFIF